MVFSALGEIFEPKTFSGLFGAAPSVAIASLALTYQTNGANAVATSAHWMLIGTVAMLAYTRACIATTRRHGLPVWLGASASWFVWIAVALLLWLGLHRVVPG